ncbi:hypothetical protein ACG33_11160 [Steroidobacter denitrificans]|uniref:Translocation and assembly module TamB C-terminal domain-containing protein n=1 Tax=Steroidobacter denitrificans TaxID=465721 RepID=A0A127FDI7_STEDE|nr:translocation/assembly module TamB domain-containing protein [Steroidobacter denitrificans]AMN47648.1 hypothetical protein ACG33_11160 [Steroidobacter denitrificans]
MNESYAESTSGKAPGGMRGADVATAGMARGPVRALLRWMGLGAAVIMAAVLCGLLWLVNTQQGARWAAELAGGLLQERLSIQAPAGTLAGPLTLEGLRYMDPLSGLTVEIEQLQVDLRWLALLRGVVRIGDARLRGVRVVLGASSPSSAEAESTPFSLQPPIDISMDRLRLEDAVVSSPSASSPAPLLELIHAELAGEWTKAAIVLRQLDVLAAQGELHFSGRLAQRDVYEGEAQGRFHWQAGQQHLTGDLRAVTQQERADLVLQLSAPLPARLDASLRQAGDWPWRFVLDVPAFDPRKTVLPESGMRRLAASLRGEGNSAAGEVRGRIDLDGVPVRIEPLRFTRDEDEITLDPLKIFLGGSSGGEDSEAGDSGTEDAEAEGPGTGDAGAEDTEGSPAAGTLVVRGVLSSAPALRVSAEVDWQDLQIPARWAGQQLHSRGRLQVRGNMDAYTALGQLQIGPPRAPVDIALDVTGSNAAIEVKELALRQSAGELTALGRVALKPVIGWHLAAAAKTFDPGALAADWPGRVSFQLDTEGRMGERGADGTLVLRNLRGRLRDRPVEGRADMDFSGLGAAGQPTLRGRVALRSGDSRIDLHAAPAGGAGTLEASAQLDVCSLDDWMPGARGRLRARAEVRGTWPALDLEVAAQSQALQLAQLRSDALDLQLQVRNVSKPSGQVRLDLSGVGAAGFEFGSLQLRVDGDQEMHRLTLTALGERLNTDLEMRGTQSEAGWSGSIERLQLTVPEVARLSLEAPAALEIDAQGAMELRQTCLSGDEMRFCAALTRQADGVLQASYALEGLRLALANALVPALPVAVSGTIEGRGELRRTAQGELFGQAGIELPGGRITPAQTPPDAPAGETLLEYAQLRLQAELTGAEARATLSGRLGEVAQDRPSEDGRLEGRVWLRGLEQPTSELDGELFVSIPSLSPLAAFIPQLAEVAGRVDLRASVAGTLEAPRLSGELQASELAAQIPELGLKLTDGRVSATPDTEGVISLDGEIHSGTGTLAFTGRLTPEGRIQANVKGRDFLAADIPAAHVIVAPELAFERDEQRMRLSGEVSIPRADVDLSKLPAGGAGGRRASPDVVVLDDEDAVQEAQAVPLQADITIILGDAVKLAGFGLDARVGGRLNIQERPDSPTVGTGNIKVEGAYKAYGQDLSIQRGQLLFASTPLDDPGLNIVAVRKVEQVTAGLKVEGTARSPQLSVFSDPVMTQSEALAYLVTGRPLERIGSSEGDADALHSAARSIGTAGGGLLAKSIGGRLGLDEVGIESNDMVGGATFTVGQYLSPRLYLSYGVGLFDPGEVITLRYRLTEALSVQTARGSSETRAGIEYRLEK